MRSGRSIPVALKISSSVGGDFSPVKARIPAVGVPRVDEAPAEFPEPGLPRPDSCDSPIAASTPACRVPVAVDPSQ